MTRRGTTSVPCRLTRLGVVMSADPSADFEAEGVLNPASGRSQDGRLWLLPRLVAAGNVSRIGIAEVLVRDGQPAGCDATALSSLPMRAGRDPTTTPGSKTRARPGSRASASMS